MAIFAVVLVIFSDYPSQITFGAAY